MNRIEQQLAASSSNSTSQGPSSLSTTQSAIGPVSKFNRIELFTVHPTQKSPSETTTSMASASKVRDEKTSLLPPSYAISKDADPKDKLRNALDGLHALAIQSFPGEKGRINMIRDRPAPNASGSSGMEEKWPNILKPGQEVKQTGRWFRDMAEILDAIPPPAQLAVLTDYYFRKVQGMREFPTHPAMV